MGHLTILGLYPFPFFLYMVVRAVDTWVNHELIKYQVAFKPHLSVFQMRHLSLGCAQFLKVSSSIHVSFKIETKPAL